MDGLRVAGTDPKEIKLGLTEDKLCFIFDGVWEWFLFKRYELAQGKQLTEVFRDIFQVRLYSGGM